MNSRIFSISGVGTLAIAGAMFVGPLAFAQTASVSDAQVEANVLRALAGAPQLATQQIKTTTVYGTVTLSGSVSDESTRVLAEDLASRAQGVQKVVDELTLTSDRNATSPAGQPQPYPQPADGQQGQGSNPTLQSDGTVAPPPDAAQNGQQPQGASEPGYTSPAAPPDNGQYSNNAPQPQGQNAPPAYRQPYRGGQPPAYSQQQPPQYGAQEGGREVTIPSGALVRMRLSEGLTAKLIRPGTAFDGTVLNDVIADGEVAIPRGAAVQGTIVVRRMLPVRLAAKASLLSN